MNGLKLKMSAFFVLEIKNSQNDQIFQFFKRPFLRNGWPYGYDFWRVLRDHDKAAQTIFLKI